jgi:hypothetical protein
VHVQLESGMSGLRGNPGRYTIYQFGHGKGFCLDLQVVAGHARQLQYVGDQVGQAFAFLENIIIVELFLYFSKSLVTNRAACLVKHPSLGCCPED